MSEEKKEYKVVGFDMDPPLGRNATDRRDWELFLEALKEKFAYHDMQEYYETRPNRLYFFPGYKGSSIPLEGFKFKRFMVPLFKGDIRADFVMELVVEVAMDFFYERVWYWREGDPEGEGDCYAWEEVEESFESYNRV